MSRLIEAAERLQAAVAKLEQAAARRVPEAGGDALELRAALQQAQAENATLTDRVDRVAERLDLAIRRIQVLLEA